MPLLRARWREGLACVVRRNRARTADGRRLPSAAARRWLRSARRRGPVVVFAVRLACNSNGNTRGSPRAAVRRWVEAVAMVPQIVLLHKTGGTQPFVCVYIAGMGMYRLLYICNWIFRHLSLRASSRFSSLRFTCAAHCGCAVESTGKALVRVARFRQSNGSCGPPAAHSLGCWCCRSRMSSSCKCVGLNPTKPV